MQGALLCALALVASAAPSSPTVDRWLLTGHGAAGRVLWSGVAGGEWTVKLSDFTGKCAELEFETPFWGASAYAGLAVNDYGRTKPQLAVPLSCTAGSMIWTVDPTTGQGLAKAVPVTNFDSYLVYLPDGSLLGRLGLRLRHS
jgi:hypothetical protein